MFLTWVDYSDCGTESTNSGACIEENPSTLEAYKVHQMEYDESFACRLLFFLGQTENSSGNGSTTANIRLDILNLD